MSPFPVVDSPETTPPVRGSIRVWLRPKACIGLLHLKTGNDYCLRRGNNICIVNCFVGPGTRFLGTNPPMDECCKTKSRSKRGAKKNGIRGHGIDPAEAC
jgi:hypothetical protein